MKIAIICDTHWGARSDNQSMLKYFSVFYKKVFFPYIDKHNIDTVVHLGDLFDRRKFINFYTLSVFHKFFLDPLSSRKIDFRILLGNHDVYYKNSNSLNSITELFYDMDNVIVYPMSTKVSFDGVDFGFVPWINSENEKETKAFLKKAPSILFGHFEINGFEFVPGVMSRNGFDDDNFKKFDTVLSGHYHRKMSRKNIHYLGAPYEMTWSDYGDRRGFHVFDTDTRELVFIENPHKIFHKIMYDDTNTDYFSFDAKKYKGCYVKLLVLKKENPYMFEKLLDKFYDSDLSDLTIVEDLKEYDVADDVVDMAKSTQDLFNEYVDALVIREDKERIKKIISEFYVEALNMETF